jgi:hypothetical protein
LAALPQRNRDPSFSAYSMHRMRATEHTRYF